MANNPRKFSEKIALHNQKQAEGTAEFEKVLQEVFGAIKGPQTRLNEPVNQQLNNGAELNQQQQQQTSNHISLQQSHQMMNQQQQLYNTNDKIY